MTITLHGVNICQRALAAAPPSPAPLFFLPPVSKRWFCAEQVLRLSLDFSNRRSCRNPRLFCGRRCLPTTREWFSGHCPRICRRFVFSCTVL